MNQEKKYTVEDVFPYESFAAYNKSMALHMNGWASTTTELANYTQIHQKGTSVDILACEYCGVTAPAEKGCCIKCGAPK